MRANTLVPIILALCAGVACTSDPAISGFPGNQNLPSVSAFAETAPVPDDDDAADDPYIMVTPSGNVIIAGTNKRRGVELYDLQGKKIASIDSGRVNNVDGYYDELSGTFLLAGSNRTNNQVDVYRVTTNPVDIQLVQRFDVPFKEPYGLCVSPDYIYVGDKEGLVQAWEWDGNGPTSTFMFKTQTEGCVVDTRNNVLYVGEEMTGIWQINLQDNVSPVLFASVNKDQLIGDVEGLDIYNGDKRRILLASSQGDSTYIAYDLANAELLAKFSVAATTTDNGTDGTGGVLIDSTRDTDGIAVSSIPLAAHPEGLFVVQDGFNTNSDGSAANQNFKIIDWREVGAVLDTSE